MPIRLGSLADVHFVKHKNFHNRARKVEIDDINIARDALMKRGIEVGEFTDFKTVKYAEFRDPDGNSWLLQEFPPEVRQPGQSFYTRK